MNILLITSCVNSKDDALGLADHMPYGLGYIAATLKKYTTHNVSIIDVPHQDVDYSYIATVIKDREIDIIGISAVVANYLFCVDFTKFLSNAFPHVKIVMGGALPSALPEIVSEDCCVDILVRGPGEMVFCEIVNNIEHYSSISNNVVSGWFPESMEDIP